ncbi:MAG: PilZ domain [Nitrospirae bacterium]|nr:PilZ domain [Nitrospirota bacterium]
MSEPALVSGQMRYILVVDSDWNDRFTLSMLLQRFGYTVASTSSAREGVEFLCVAPAAAVFAEGGAVGKELAARLKADVRFRDMPLILVVSGQDRDLEKQLSRGELAGLLRTPVNPDDVFQVIQKATEGGSRKNIRIPTALPAELRDEHGGTEGYVTVLSQYGMFFRTLEPRAVKARTGVSISFGDRMVDLRAEVLYIVSFEKGPFCEPGMGMKFVDIAPADSALLRFFIHEQLGAGIIPSGPAAGQA